MYWSYFVKRAVKVLFVDQITSNIWRNSHGQILNSKNKIRRPFSFEIKRCLSRSNRASLPNILAPFFPVHVFLGFTLYQCKMHRRSNQRPKRDIITPQNRFSSALTFSSSSQETWTHFFVKDTKDKEKPLQKKLG